MNVRIVVLALLMGVAAEANLVVNGNFEAGNTGFVSSYNYNSNGNAEGNYYVGTNSKAWNGNIADPTYDHTSGYGLMLLANGVLNLPVWSQSVSVTAGTEYEFSGWCADIAQIYTDPILEFLVDGDSLGTITPTYNTWSLFSNNWTATATGDVTLLIRTTVAASLGNDFAVDDLSFEAIPEPASAAFLVVSVLGAGWIRRRFVD